MNRAALYLRVSTDEQAERYGLPAQRRELRALAERKGYQVVGEFVDDGYSGAMLERPQLTRLRDAVRTGAVDVVLILDPDRLARDLFYQLLVDREFEKARVRTEYATMSFEASPAGKMFYQFKGAIAQYEGAVISERTERGRVEKARRGLVACGPYAFGYRADQRGVGGLVVHEDEAAIVRLVFKLFVGDRLSTRAIALELQQLGMTAPRSRHWDRRAVRRILTCRTYAGEWVYESRRAPEPIIVPVPAIVTAETLERARQQLDRNRSVLVGRPSPFAYLLRGLVRCGACGRRWTGTSWKHDIRYRVYRCNGRDREYVPPCTAPTLKADRLEGVVWETTAGILRNPGVLASRLDDRLSRLGVREVEVRSEAEYLARQLTELERQTQRLLDLYQRGAGLEDDLSARLSALGDQRRAVRDSLERAQRQAVEAGASESDGDAVARACQDALRGLEQATPGERQRLLQLVVHEITVLDDGAELAIDGWLPAGSVLTAGSR